MSPRPKIIDQYANIEEEPKYANWSPIKIAQLRHKLRKQLKGECMRGGCHEKAYGHYHCSKHQEESNARQRAKWRKEFSRFTDPTKPA